MKRHRLILDDATRVEPVRLREPEEKDEPAFDAMLRSLMDTMYDIEQRPQTWSSEHISSVVGQARLLLKVKVVDKRKKLRNLVQARDPFDADFKFATIDTEALGDLRRDAISTQTALVDEMNDLPEDSVLSRALRSAIQIHERFIDLCLAELVRREHAGNTQATPPAPPEKRRGKK